MVKKAKVFKPGDYVFAKVKGYPAWPAKVVALNGKKYNIHFFGTGETGNLPANDLFDYFEHKQQFMAKAIKRRDYNDGMAEIDSEVQENGITSNSGIAAKEGDAEGDVSTVSLTNQSAMDTSTDMDTMNETAPSESDADVSKSAKNKVNESQTDKESEDVEMTPAAPLQASTTEDSAEESPQKVGSTTTVEETETIDASVVKAVTPAHGKGKKNITPTVKTPQPKTPRRAAIAAAKLEMVPEHKTPAPDSVSRSGRKIKPKRYLDEETEDLSAPVGAKRSKVISQSGDDEITLSAVPVIPPATAASPAASAPTSKVTSAKKTVNGDMRKIGGRFRYVNQSELANIQEPFTSDVTDSSLGQQQKDNILIVFLPNGKLVGIKLFVDRPESFATPAVRLQWENKTAKNYIKLKQQLENGEVKPESLPNQLVSDLKLTEDEINMLKKEKDLDVQRNQLNFLRVEAKLLELENQMRSALGFSGPDPALGIKCLQQINALEIRPLMLLKHPSILETIKRTRHYVGKGDALTEEEKDEFNLQAHEIRKLSEQCFNSCKAMFKVEEGKTFLEMFSILVLRFKQCIKDMSEMEIMEMYEEPPEMSQLGAYSLTLDDCDESGDRSKEKGGTPERILSPAQDNSSPHKTPTKKVSESSSKSSKKDKPK